MEEENKKRTTYTESQKKAINKYRTNNKEKINKQRKKYYQERKEKDDGFMEYKRIKAREYYQRKKGIKPDIVVEEEKKPMKTYKELKEEQKA